MDNHSYDVGGGFDVLWDLGLCDGYVVGCVGLQTGWDTSDCHLWECGGCRGCRKRRECGECWWEVLGIIWIGLGVRMG